MRTILAWTTTAFMVAAAIGGAARPAASAELDIATNGGLKAGARIVKVTSLADAGPGTLRAAIEASGPRIVVFEVAGYIELQSDLSISRGQVTVAGQTAPGGGVILRGGTLGIRASEVEIEHIAVYPGSTSDPEVADQRDAITIYGSVSRQNVIRNVILRNVSIGWGVDENIGVNGLVDGVRIESSLVAEALMNGGHPKGNHSMNVLFGDQTKRVLILGNVLAASNQRNPRLTDGNIASVQNNFIYGYGALGTHIDASLSAKGGAQIDVIGNVYRTTPDSRCGQPAIQISSEIYDAAEPSSIHVGDNRAIDESGCSDQPADPFGASSANAASPSHSVPSWQTEAAESVFPAILQRVGSHPAARNPIDRRIVDGISAGSERLIDREEAVGGYPQVESTQRALVVPMLGTTVRPSDVPVLSVWLCTYRLAAAGLPLNCH